MIILKPWHFCFSPDGSNKWHILILGLVLWDKWENNIWIFNPFFLWCLIKYHCVPTKSTDAGEVAGSEAVSLVVAREVAGVDTWAGTVGGGVPLLKQSVCHGSHCLGRTAARARNLA